MKELLQVRDYRQPHEMEMVQLVGNLNEIDETLNQWIRGNITNKEFASRTRNIITFLRTVAHEISTTFEGVMESYEEIK